jgi:hypothetical protein
MLQGEQSNCPELGEKIWETVAQGHKLQATVLLPKDNNLTVSPQSHAISVLLPTLLYNFVEVKS